ncbi:UDP-3-O-[3-hydroxymyristoyl] glucosamine N-acyltransferase [Paenibacillus uliginis N3/975]|uniref:UDP-3-O-acylglucosamine N-acyltransferase n=1 Tax=Paenibacillus uliginis N3/975 TaxID=1313296 RepID=A0A1X7GA92_9BACL|nr:UDP-3-O-(3-hydroxymyristoyl)glucosamine N-acyltransferase [Paenibacillus uliginis]SMF66688.1 UDP-3-O-[3-hydroxymyristoyl] glucosamine N-acyltransferase [Paenibacillus uliginis N3/975]
MAYNLKSIAQALNGSLVGDGDIVIHSIASFLNAKDGQIAYVSGKNVNKLTTCCASALVIPDNIVCDFLIPVIKVKNPRLAFVHLVGMFQDKIESNGKITSSMIDVSSKLGYCIQIDDGTVIKEGVSIGDHTVIGSNSFIGKNVFIGENCFIHPNVTISKDTVIGNNVIIHSGSVIGSDGFGYEWDGERHVKIPHVGNIVIFDDVEIGANTTIDRGTIDSTIIGKGTKIDNLVQIGHNVQIGEHCLIVATSGIAGSTTIGNHVTLAGGCGITGHVSIGDHSIILARTCVGKDLPPKSVVSGIYARPHKEQLKELAVLSRLPRTIKEINKKLEVLLKK